MLKKKRNIILVGFMGSGKSAVAAKLSAVSGWECRELDSLIEIQEQKTISEIFRDKGEPYFREIETAMLKKYAEKEHSIISCGGGTPLREENAAIMKENGIVFWLKADPHTIYSRVKYDENRPLLRDNMNPEYIETMLNARSKNYESVSDYEIVTDGKSVEEICTVIMSILAKVEEDDV